MRRFLSFAAIVVLAVACSGEEVVRKEHVPSDEEIARRFVPEDVLKDLAEWPGEKLEVAVERVDLGRTGSADYLVAAYAGLESGGLKVIRLRPSPEVVVDVPDPMGGRSVDLKLVDVDGDGTPEIAAYFSSPFSAGPEAMHVYRWNEGRLQPLFDGSVPEAIFQDLDGDGKLETIGSVFRGTELIQPVHKLSGGKYVPAGGLLSCQWVHPKLNPREDEFEILAGAPVAGVLRVRNGDNAGAHRVRSAEVFFNGVVVINAGDLVSSRYAEAKVTLRKENKLEIRIFEPPDGEMLVWIPAPPGIEVPLLGQ